MTAPVSHQSSGLSDTTLDRVRSVFSRFPSVEKVVLYGSRAKGNYHAGSDIDLTIVGSTVTYEQLQEMEQQLDDLLLPYKIDLSLFHHIDNPNLVAHVERVGQVLFAGER